MLSQQKFQSEKSPPTNSELRKNNWKVFLVNSKKSKAVSIWKKRVSGSRHIILLEDQKSYSDFRQNY